MIGEARAAVLASAVLTGAAILTPWPVIIAAAVVAWVATLVVLAVDRMGA